MLIHSISPVSNIPRQSMLTYFSKDELSLGTLVEVLYGKNKILGIVLASDPLKNMKEIVRTQDFQLRKINRIIEKEKIDSKMVEALQTWSSQNYIPSGKILTDIFPKWFWEKEFSLLTQKIQSKKNEVTLFESSFAHRFSEYKKEILRRNTIWICIPSVLALKKIQTLIKNDEAFSDYELLPFHSTVAEQKQIKQYQSIKQDKKTIILSTPYYFGLFNTLADLTIYENAGDDGYSLGQKYAYDALTLFSVIQNKNTQYIYSGDLLPISLNTIKNKTTLQFTGYTKENTRYNELFVNPYIEQQFLSDISNNKSILLVTQYKDNNIKIVCNDCKTTVTCPKCKLTLRALVKNGQSYFHCNFCKKSYKSNVKCSTCQSWNLTALGINTKTIKEFVEKKYKEGVGLVTIASLSESEKYAAKEFDSVYVISIDGLMHSSHFGTEEKIVRTLLKIQEAGTNLYVQTSFPFPNILSAIKNITIEKWKKEELKKRKQYHYPPFGILYTITVGAIRDQKLLEKIQQTCDKQEILHIDSMYRMTIYADTKNSAKIETLLNEYRESSLVIKIDK